VTENLRETAEGLNRRISCIDVQLQVRPLRGERVQAVPGAPGQVAAQAGSGAVAGDAREAGQAGGHCQPQPAGERRWRI
jgi:hypothetical protein